MLFQHPFQCIQSLDRSTPVTQNLLVTAAGPKLYVWDSATGSQLAVWPEQIESEVNVTQVENSGSRERDDAGSSEPPGKKRKLSPAPSKEGQGGEEIQQSGTEANESKPQGAKLAWSTIPIVTASRDGEHIVAVTAEDKCIRVFKVGARGELSQLSERFMPKRPCAVVLSTDESSILCADKFGDVYSLPLFPSPDFKPPTQKPAQPVQPSQPSASTLTVHTKRNLQALQQQLKRAATITEKPAGPSFELKLLLGHVSMLTDVLSVALRDDSGVSRSYILTADRDEHIRVSRGQPQSHIIQSYCLGHTAFVSKLCIPSWNPAVLVSGGGDDFILVWNWAKGEILQKVPLNSGVAGSNGNAPELAVNGIWAVDFSENESLRQKAVGAVVITLEGVPKFFPFIFSLDGKLIAQSPVDLSGNALAVTSLDRKGTILVSVDNIHEPGSTKEQRKSPESPQQLLQVVSILVEADTLKWTQSENAAVDAVSKQGTFDLPPMEDEKGAKKSGQTLISTLYGIGNLRKWGKGDEE
ncbi:tRNA (guanine-N(7)-)-methyltransferase non-catalytic subunit trm82 [Onygenales sp. PD_40]|nr:tRNA (guanine-N(7)-)-methyltransferase non-catalytic subunit trm82 [Onygenales sp. PD_40]KAK2799131.1 tRNA (guanine-N(7)-)-methyltransferase non-catalytic subunit trm82 [Onygenales sp. PD_10]